jgi:hypothetical protein
MTAEQTVKATATPRYAKVFFWINAVVAWLAVGVSFTLAVTGYYVDMMDPATPTILGNVPGGNDTVLERLLDWSTYFTILSNIVVVIVTTMLVARPDLFTRTDRTGTIWRTLRLDSVLMIVITGVVYNLLLATGGKTGWDLISNTLLHVLVPILTPIVWIIAGPRGLITPRIIGYSLVLPLLWAAYALIRGAAVGAYPYPFLDVATNGVTSVVVFIAVIVVIAVLLALVLWAVDAGLRWTLRGNREPTAAAVAEPTAD